MRSWLAKALAYGQHLAHRNSERHDVGNGQLRTMRAAASRKFTVTYLLRGAVRITLATCMPPFDCTGVGCVGRSRHLCPASQVVAG